MGAFPDSLIKAIGKRAKLVAPILIMSNNPTYFFMNTNIHKNRYNNRNNNNNSNKGYL